MLSAENSDPPNQSLQITQHDKFYSRLLSKESSLANSSFRVYYGGASGAVPFLWESQPGTPKNTISTSTSTPLAPPPSYHFNNKRKATKKSSPKINSLRHRTLPRLTPKKTSLPSSPASLSLPSVSSSGSSDSHQSSFDDNESADEGSPTSTLCNNHGGNSRQRGCYSMVIMKNALLSIIGSHGSS